MKSFMPSPVDNSDFHALIVRQWLEEWNKVKFDSEINQAKPPGHFYLLSLPAATLRSLSGIYRRKTVPDERRSEDLGIQRQHDVERSLEIGKFVREGFPYSTLSPAQRRALEEDSSNLQKPGWLPSAIIVNILKPGDVRPDGTLGEEDAMHIPSAVADHETLVEYSLPSSWERTEWTPKSIRPIEVIDGQHRLWAFDQVDDQALNFNLPVVAFCGLDISWQAYLFWIINIKPKRINASLAFDLYPLLRDQDWLKAGEGLMVYRETRAQELTEALWGTPQNPWYQRINMLGETGVREAQPVTQAAFVNALVVTFVRSWDRRGNKVGGLFGGSSSEGKSLNWPRIQQAGFLCSAWKLFDDAIRQTHAAWAIELRGISKSLGRSNDSVAGVDLAFSSPLSLLSSDQGVRAVFAILNDFTYEVAKDYKLHDWKIFDTDEGLRSDTISLVMKEVEELPIAEFLVQLCKDMATYDWRTSKVESLSSSERTNKLAFRGSGGYVELRRQIVEHLVGSSNARVREVAETLKSQSK